MLYSEDGGFDDGAVEMNISIATGNRRFQYFMASTSAYSGRAGALYELSGFQVGTVSFFGALELVERFLAWTFTWWRFALRGRREVRLSNMDENFGR
jgi:hypothetical protein